MRACIVAVGTENFRDPAAAARVREELFTLLANAGYASVSDAVGAAHAPPSHD